ncbi:MAG TPA: hypothetical protein VF599_15395 [Pyrinomonadaceae bacterium]|jgi:hypothetical protein
MSQEENGENIIGNEGAKGAAEGTAETESATDFTGEKAEEQEMSADSPGLADDAEVDNLPVESIGSYARVEPLLTDEEADETTSRGSES